MYLCMYNVLYWRLKLNTIQYNFTSGLGFFVYLYRATLISHPFTSAAYFILVINV